MISKRTTTVLGTCVIAAFAYVGYTDAVRIWQNLQDQEKQVETLNVTREELNQELDHTLETKSKSQEEVDRLEKEKQELEELRRQLEEELQS